MIDEQRWTRLLAEWMADGNALWLENQDRWTALGLPPINLLRIVAPDVSGASLLRSRVTALVDPEVFGLYSITDGWPLWLGSSWSVLAQVARVGLFRSAYPDAFDIAVSSAPEHREVRGQAVSIGRREIRDSVVLSEPDAREIVLSLPSGEACLYQFDSMIVFRDLFDFMVYQKRASLDWVREILIS